MSVTTSNSQQPPNTALMGFIERASRDDSFDVGKFGELLRLQREEVRDQQRRAFNQALAAAQAEMEPVARNAHNKHLGNKYATLEQIDNDSRPIYTAHGFSVRYGSAIADQPGHTRITITVAHIEGFEEKNHLDSPLAGKGAQGGKTQTTDVQAVGATITYLRRYLLTMVFNIVLAGDDKDGEEQRKGYDPPPPPPTPRPSWNEFMDRLETSVMAAPSADEIDTLLNSTNVTKARQAAKSPATHERLEAIVTKGSERAQAMRDDAAEAQVPADEADQPPKDEPPA